MTVTGTIGGNSIEGHVRSLHRTHSICDPGQQATLVLNTTYPTAVTTSEAVELYEDGTLVLTGYVIKARRERPSYDWTIDISDTYTRCTNTFIEDKLTTGVDPATDQLIQGYTPLTVAYWLGYLCDLAGISYSIDSGLTTSTIPAGTQLGLRTVHDSLMDVTAYGAMAMFVSPSGTLHFKRIIRNVPTYTFTSGYELQDSTSDEFTRNVVKVFGYSSGNERAFGTASVSIPGISPDRITSVGSPMIQDDATAQQLADYLISELGVQSRVVSLRMAGDPTVKLGFAARINVGSTNYCDAISSLDVHTDEDGYTMSVTIGERCPRIAGWSSTQATVYAGTSGSGVYKSTDNGATWVDFNAGLPAAKKYVNRVAANSYDEVMCICNDVLYYTDGTTAWQTRSLPTPVNTAGDSPAVGYGTLVSVDATGLQGGFAVLTTNGNSSSGSAQSSRSWVYESSGSGATSWSSTQCYDNTSGSESYSLFALDMSSSFGTPTVLATSGSIDAQLPGWFFLYGDMSRQAAQNSAYYDPTEVLDPADDGIISYTLKSVQVTGFSPFRLLKVTFNINRITDIYSPTIWYRSVIGQNIFMPVDTGPYVVGSGLVSSGTYGTNTAEMSITIAESTAGANTPFICTFAFSAWNDVVGNPAAKYIRNGDPRSPVDNIVPWYANDDVYLCSGAFTYMFSS